MSGLDTSPVRVLVVDDDPMFRTILQKRLAHEGYDVSLAPDGREGMRVIVTEEPDLVLSDWMMPHVDGLELCQAVKTGLREAAPYFVLLTAKGEISDQLLALETGADDYVVKPCDMGELMARVRGGLKHVTLVRELRRTRADLIVAQNELAAARAELSHVVMLDGCPGCGKVASGGDTWEALAGYLERTGVVRFRPRPCPACTPRGGNGDGTTAPRGRTNARRGD